MEKIYKIDETTRIKVIKDNFILQYKQKSKTGGIAWHTDGYFPNLTMLSNEYLNTAPYRAMQATEDFNELIETLKKAESNIRDLIINNKTNL